MRKNLSKSNQIKNIKNKNIISEKTKYPEPTYSTDDSKPFRIFGLGYRELKTVIILSSIIKYCVLHWTNPKVLSKLNPGIPRGGKGLASKNYTNTYLSYDNPVAKKYLAKYVYVPCNKSFSEMKTEFKRFHDTPVVFKPDKGARSIGVVVTTNETEQIRIFNARKKMDYIAQEYCGYQYELGVYYYRFPQWDKGKILGIAEKRFEILTGDGKKSLKELLKEVKLTKAMRTQMEHKYGSFNHVPHLGEKIMLTSTVDHYDNGVYYDRPDLITPDVERIFNEIIGDKELYFCRFDIRARSIKDFSQGKNFKILELNTGPNAVFLHAFDPRYTRRKQIQSCYDQYTIAFKLADKLKDSRKEHLIPYLWFLIKDEIPLFFLKLRVNNINKNIDNDQ